MARQIIFTSYIPTSLLGVNSASKTLAAEPITGLPIPTGILPGYAFFLSEKWANQLSTSSINGAPVLQCHAGWYMVVQIDAGATLANIWQGGVGAQLSLAAGPSDMTDMSHALNQGIDPVIFLTPGNFMTVGNYTIVQIAGDTSLLVAAGQTVTIGSILVSTAAGLVAVAGAITNTTLSQTVAIAEAALTTPAALTLTAAAAASAGSTVYTGTITGGAANAFAGFYAVMAGFDLAPNNSVAGTAFLITASTATTLTVNNPLGVADTHAGTATLQGLVRAYVNLAFGGLQ